MEIRINFVFFHQKVCAYIFILILMAKFVKRKFENLKEKKANNIKIRGKEAIFYIFLTFKHDRISCKTQYMFLAKIFK